MGECLITEVAALREENESMRQFLLALRDHCKRDYIDTDWIAHEVNKIVGEECLPKT